MKPNKESKYASLFELCAAWALISAIVFRLMIFAGLGTMSFIIGAVIFIIGASILAYKKPYIKGGYIIYYCVGLIVLLILF